MDRGSVASCFDMNPQIMAAVIAGGVGLVGVVVGLAGARLGFKATLDAARLAAEETHKDTAATLASQRQQLEATLAEEHVRTLNERFATAATQLGSDKPAVRLAGVYAMAGLADDWADNRQQCVDVLCAYIRLPYERAPGDSASTDQKAMWLADREVRLTVLRVIAAHLRPTSMPGARPVSWAGVDLDFTGAVFDGGDFSFGEFSAGRISFIEAEFIDGTFYFTGAIFTGGRVNFEGAKFTGGWLNFENCLFFGPPPGSSASPANDQSITHQFDVKAREYSGEALASGPLSFVHTRFEEGGFSFNGSRITGGTIDLRDADFEDFFAGFADIEMTGGTLNFQAARINGDAVHFDRSRLAGGLIDFTESRIYGEDSIVYFRETKFSGARVLLRDAKFASPCYVDFSYADFTNGIVDFTGARFAGAQVNFSNARFAGCSVILRRTEYYDNPHIVFTNAILSSGSLDFRDSKFFGGKVDLSDASFAGSMVDFGTVAKWDSPPIFPDQEEALPGLILPVPEKNT